MSYLSSPFLVTACLRLAFSLKCNSASCNLKWNRWKKERDVHVYKFLCYNRCWESSLPALHSLVWKCCWFGCKVYDDAVKWFQWWSLVYGRKLGNVFTEFSICQQSWKFFTGFWVCNIIQNIIHEILNVHTTPLKPLLVSNKPSMRALSKESAMSRVFIVNVVF